MAIEGFVDLGFKGFPLALSFIFVFLPLIVKLELDSDLELRADTLSFIRILLAIFFTRLVSVAVTMISLTEVEGGIGDNTEAP